MNLSSSPLKKKRLFVASMLEAVDDKFNFEKICSGKMCPHTENIIRT
jgi:hypothetical protein